MKFLSRLWSAVKKFFSLIWVARISLVLVILTFIVLLFVSQAEDAIIALANFGSLYHFIIITFSGIAWASLVWYWARVFYYMEYTDETGLEKWEIAVIENTPRWLGGITFLSLAYAFIKQALYLYKLDFSSALTLIIIAVIYLVTFVLFMLFVYFRRRIFKLPGSVLYRNSPNEGEFLPFRYLPPATKLIFLAVTLLAAIFFIIVTIRPIGSTIWLGDTITILILCFCMWLPILYWIAYASSRSRFPFFIIIFVLAMVFSIFNGNKNIRLLDYSPSSRASSAYFNDWYAARSKDYKPYGKKTPFIIVLAEGGGIRAAYWTASLLSGMESKNTNFSRYVFGIYGVSGGSFGVSIFDSLLKYSQTLQPSGQSGFICTNSRNIIGKDFLSPLVACMFTREIIQYVMPFPINDFDRAKVFEETWEYHWNNQVKPSAGSLSFSSPFTSLKTGDTDFIVPAIFLQTTRVEDGKPYTISSMGRDPDSFRRLVGDFYDFTPARDMRISTASLLSARFAYVSPAGTLRTEGINSNNSSSFVDGGYFDDSGADAAFSMLLEIQKSFGQDKFRRLINPIIIFLKNSPEIPEPDGPGNTAFYQLSAPVKTFFHTLAYQSLYAAESLSNYITAGKGQFITLQLDSIDTGNDDELEIPLGWALSKTVQQQMDLQVPVKVNSNCSPLFDILPR